MTWNDLREWMGEVQALGELKTVEGANWQEDIGRITEMVDHSEGSPAVVFDRIPGYAPGRRVIVNCNGTPARQAVTLGMDQAEATHAGLMARWRAILEQMRPIPPVVVDDGPILQNVVTGEAVDAEAFPAPIWHPKDGGRFIGTASVNITRDPSSEWVNLGTYRNQVFDRNKLGVLMSPGKHGRLIREQYWAKGEPCPIVVVVGCDPLLFMSACVEGLPYGMSELAWAGGVKGQPIPVVIGRHTGLPIPANAEVAFEGFMRPNVEHDEGPYGEWHGYYTRGTRTTPQIDLVAMYHRDDPILLGCPQGKPPHEDNRFLAPLRSTLIHKQIEAAGASGVTGVWCPPLAGNRLLTIVKLQQRYPGHARQVAHLAAQCGAGAYNGRYIVVVDDDIDITNMDDVWWAILTRSDPAEDVEFIRRAWSTQIDPVVPYGQVPHTSRAIIDACIPWERRQDYPESIVEPAYARETRQLWGHILNGR